MTRPAEQPTIRVSRQPRSDAGSCNACNSPGSHVYEIELGRTLVVRVCRSCADILASALRREAHR